MFNPPNLILTFKIFFILILFIISGCEKEEQPETNIKIDTGKRVLRGVNTIVPKIYKGMYGRFSGENIFIDCITKNQYLLNTELDEINKLFENNINNDEKIYFEGEGFTSVKSKTEGNGFDTVIVVTRLVKFDRTYNCEK